MPELDPIQDAFIDEIIKANTLNDTPGKTQGSRLRELIKLLRDRSEQELNKRALSSDINDKFKGKYTSLANLQSVHPTATAGDYAQVDEGQGFEVINYNYDVEEGWIQGGTGNNTDTVIFNKLNLQAGELLATKVAGTIERDTTGQLWSTDAFNNRYRVLVDDGSLIYKVFTGALSSADYGFNTTNTIERVIGNIPLGNISNNFFGRFTAIQNTILEIPVGGIAPLSIEFSYHIRINNGFYDAYVFGANLIGIDKLIQNVILTDSSYINSPSKVDVFNQVSTIYGQNNGGNGSFTGIGVATSFVNTRTADNSTNQPPANCAFSIIEKVTVTFADATNANGLNSTRRVIVGTPIALIEKIR